MTGTPIIITTNSPIATYNQVIQNGHSSTMFNCNAIINIVNVNKSELMIKRAQMFLTNLQINIKIPNVSTVCPTPNTKSKGPTDDSIKLEINTPSTIPSM